MFARGRIRLVIPSVVSLKCDIKCTTVLKRQGGLRADIIILK